ncbi:IS5 family transposase [Streptomyces sp. NPDC048179]|uniref:IS5 family transposase n=1 Tax=Streptomyces sp. NPDC048179 TaxID=3365506 RepID=UPI00371A4535
MRQRRYPSDVTDAEWSVIEPLLPPPAWTTRRGGRPEKHPRREIVDGIRYVCSEGCRWRALPSDFPPHQTVYGFFRRWTRAGGWNTVRDHLRREVRCKMGTSPHAVATVLDAQSVKASETVGRDSRGWDGGKLINGRKRHLLTETHGLPLDVMVTSAGLHDSKPAKDLLTRARRLHPELAIVWADSAYRGPFAEWAKTELKLTVKTVNRPKDAKGFVVLPRRWVVERSWAWVMHARRLVRDHERLPESSEAMINLAAIRLMTRRLTRPTVYPTAGRPRPGETVKAA